MSDKPNRQAAYVEERDEGLAARRRSYQLKTMTAELCQYATDYRAKLLRECDERNKV